ncbi:YopX family protein [Campylobacter helveticus]|uniref:YopX family protein n=1 Tax=Campylobacter helveticus TaxID=28898 RepID=UPI0010451975|nr:YopX family protein [Campylobacter helveticus]QBL12755.1 hypothetical protein A0073_10020 [Campylobacter helveticus]
MKLKDFNFRLVMSEAFLENEVKCQNEECPCANFKIFYDKEAVLTFSDLAFNDLEAQIDLFTGFKDKNDNKIYENDFIEFKTSLRNYKTYQGQVIFKEACFYALSDDNVYRLNGLFDMKVLGNIHEDKELLEQTKQNAPKKYAIKALRIRDEIY